MGTTVELHVRDVPADADVAAIDTAFAWLHQVDERFSTYRPESEISRIARGALAERDASADVRFVLAECDAMHRRTDGFFDARHCGLDGSLDPSGYVKGWALERAAEIVAAAGLRNFALNGGGDMVARGPGAPGLAWRVGIRHPLRREEVAAVIAVSDLAVATSGGYERPGHIVEPHSGRVADELLSVTVVGPSLTVADVFATAAFAMGCTGLDWLAAQPDYEGCAITPDQRLRSTAGFEALRVRG